MGRLLKALQKIEAAEKVPAPLPVRKSQPDFQVSVALPVAAAEEVVALGDPTPLVPNLQVVPAEPVAIQEITASSEPTAIVVADPVSLVEALKPVDEVAAVEQVPCAETSQPELETTSLPGEQLIATFEDDPPVEARVPIATVVQAVALPSIEEIVPTVAAPPAAIAAHAEVQITDLPLVAASGEMVRLSDFLAQQDDSELIPVEMNSIVAELDDTREPLANIGGPAPSLEIDFEPESLPTTTAIEEIPLPRPATGEPLVGWGWELLNWPTLTAEEDLAVRQLDAFLASDPTPPTVIAVNDPLQVLQDLLRSEDELAKSSMPDQIVPVVAGPPVSEPSPAEDVTAAMPIFATTIEPGTDTLSTTVAVASPTIVARRVPAVADADEPGPEEFVAPTIVTLPEPPVHPSLPREESHLASRFRETASTPQIFEFRSNEVVLPEEEGIAILGGHVAFWSPPLDADATQPTKPVDTTLEGAAEFIIQQQPALAGRVLLLVPTSHQVRMTEFAADLCLALGPHVQTPIEFVDTATFSKSGSPEQFLQEKCAQTDLILIVATSVDALTLARWSGHSDAIYLVGNHDDEPKRAVDRLIARWPYAEDRLYGCILRA